MDDIGGTAGVAYFGGRNEGEAAFLCPTSFGKAGEELGGGGVPYGKRKLLGEEQTDGSGFAGTQRSGNRIWARIAQTFSCLKDTHAEFFRQLVGPVVGIGDGSARNVQFLSERGEGRTLRLGLRHGYSIPKIIPRLNRF